MKKYLKITIILGIFFALVIYRQSKSDKIKKPIVKISPLPSPTPASAYNNISQQRGIYKDGVYTGIVADAVYGNLQVKVQINKGKINDVFFLQYPNDNNTSNFINSQAMPILKAEAIQAQNKNVDMVTGASDSSRAFRQSVESALQEAKL